MKQKKKGMSVQELIGIRGFTDYGLLTDGGELLFFQLAPTNISVLSGSSIEAKIQRWMMILSACPELEIVCTDAAECFDDNKRFFHERKEVEDNGSVRDLLEKDDIFLDQMQAEVATARQFVLIGRCKNAKPEQVFQTVNRLRKVLSDEGIEVKHMKKSDIKRFLGLYFGATGNGEQVPDIDGEQYAETMRAVERNEQKKEIPQAAPEPDLKQMHGGLEFGGGFGGYQRESETDNKQNGKESLM